MPRSLLKPLAETALALVLCLAAPGAATAAPAAGEAPGPDGRPPVWAAAPLSTITGYVETFEYLPFLSGRRCWVYLPPGYFESTDSYPVLYMHDGQFLFDEVGIPVDEWQVDETCESLISNLEIEPIIVVGIEHSADRCIEYTPWYGVDPGILCWSGGGGDAYLQAIIDELIPEVNRRYRTKTGPEHTYMAGSSLGGLISIYAGYVHDDVWGRVAALSTYFPWADHALLTFAAGRTKPDLSRFYQDMGTREFGFTDRDTSGVDDYIEDLRAMRDIALAQGFVEGTDFLSVEAAYHTHTERYWAARMPDVLRFLIDPPGGVLDVPGRRPGPAEGIRGVFPNPFQATTRIELSLASPRDVRVDLYDVSGRLVRRLLEGHLPTGERSLSWDGRDGYGRPAASGAYWIQVRSGSELVGATRLVRLP